MKPVKFSVAVSVLIALLLAYAAVSKLCAYEESKREMMNQVFPVNIALVLTWLVPVIELTFAIGLVINKFRFRALIASCLLLIVFSLYIVITMSGSFGRIPCSCGGILENMSYSAHLVFNLIFIVMAILAIALETQWKSIHNGLINKKRKEVMN
jgi:putative oxidoreductase